MSHAEARRSQRNFNMRKNYYPYVFICVLQAKRAVNFYTEPFVGSERQVHSTGALLPAGEGGAGGGGEVRTGGKTA